MSQKEQVEELLKAGKGYDEIEDQTGSARSYIRSIAVGYRKGVTETKAPPAQTEQAAGGVQRVPETPAQTPGMNFLDDGTPQQKAAGKSGADYHKAWVKAAKYECGACGATVGKTSGFCPHCGETLVWDGIE